jgi:Protein of unknown function (DUF616)
MSATFSPPSSAAPPEPTGPAAAGGRTFARSPGAPMQTVLYTCTYLAYDQIFSPVRTTPGLEYVLHADRRPRFVRGWQWRPLPAETAGLDQTMANRWCKFFPHRLFPEAEISIYVDGNTLILGDLTPLIAEFAASGADIGLFEHKERGDIFAELEFCRKVGKIRPEEAERGRAQVDHYRAAGLPEEHAFTENGIIFRRHTSPALDGAMQLWWNQLTLHTKRDQLSLPYVLHITGIRPKIWSWNYKFPNPYFKRYPHKKSPLKDLNTYMRNKMLYRPIYYYAFSPVFKLHRSLFRPAPRDR